VTSSPEDIRRKLLEAAFSMPSVQTMVSRKSSITNAFVSAIIPTIPPSLGEIEQALTILGMEPTDVRCAYCGDKATEWDHLRPLVLNRRPTGFISEIHNLVPSCGKCNQSKGNKPWRKWMLSKAKHSPTGRGVPDIAGRIAKLEAYEAWRSPTKVNFEAIVGIREWESYWKLCDDVISELRKCQEVADSVQTRIAQAIHPK
jgi:hypothetical protein